jgi:hypothetical protein
MVRRELMHFSHEFAAGPGLVDGAKGRLASRSAWIRRPGRSLGGLRLDGDLDGAIEHPWKLGAHLIERGLDAFHFGGGLYLVKVGN